MTDKKRVLIFPCGTEIGLEIHRSLSHSTHVEVYGANSIEPNHGAFVFKQYVGRLPLVYDPLFIPELKDCILKHEIDFVYPAHDDVALALSRHEAELGCAVIGSPRETCELCRSKSATYARFQGVLRTPAIYSPDDPSVPFPLFLKPDKGQGSRGARAVHSRAAWDAALERESSLLALEYLPGVEYTVDCFTDRHGRLRFSGGRERVRTAGGISTHTCPVRDEVLSAAAQCIQQALIFRGAWFFQMKRDARGQLALLEVAPRVSGGMGLFRALGVNLPLLSVYDRAGLDVDILPLCLDGAMDRALIARFDLDIHYAHVYVDLDDTLLRDGQVDTLLIAFLFQCRNRGVGLHLLTRHAGDVEETLFRHALSGLFDSITHLTDGQSKSAAITHGSAVFIDDSHAERAEVHTMLGIPVFAPDAVEALMDWRY